MNLVYHHRNVNILNYKIDAMQGMKVFLHVITKKILLKIAK